MSEPKNLAYMIQRTFALRLDTSFAEVARAACDAKGFNECRRGVFADDPTSNMRWFENWDRMTDDPAYDRRFSDVARLFNASSDPECARVIAESPVVTATHELETSTLPRMPCNVFSCEMINQRKVKTCADINHAVQELVWDLRGAIHDVQCLWHCDKSKKRLKSRVVERAQSRGWTHAAGANGTITFRKKYMTIEMRVEHDGRLWSVNMTALVINACKPLVFTYRDELVGSWPMCFYGGEVACRDSVESFLDFIWRKGGCTDCLLLAGCSFEMCRPPLA